MVDAFEKSSRKNNLNYESSSLLIRRLKNQTGFTLQPFTHNRNSRGIKSKVARKWNRLADNRADSVELLEQPNKN
jgi:hypothetical protein